MLTKVKIKMESLTKKEGRKGRKREERKEGNKQASKLMGEYVGGSACIYD